MPEAFWRGIDRLIVTVGGLILMVAVFHVSADVISKYLFSQPIAGTIIYVSNYYMTAIVFLPLVAAEYRKQHISVDLWPSAVPTYLLRWSDHFVGIFSALVYGLLAYASLTDALRKYREGEFALDQGGQVFTWPSYFILPIGFALVACLLLTRVFFRPEIRKTNGA